MNMGNFIVTGLLAVAPLFAHPALASEDKVITVFKTPLCGCCNKWVEALQKAGFKMIINDLEDLSSIKKQASVTKKLEACHTAVLGEYVLEGHVPLVAVDKLLAERPVIRGLAVPGMPQGSLGMGFDKNARYTVFSFQFDTSKSASVFYESGV